MQSVRYQMDGAEEIAEKSWTAEEEQERRSLQDAGIMPLD